MWILCGLKIFILHYHISYPETVRIFHLFHIFLAKCTDNGLMEKNNNYLLTT